MWWHLQETTKYQLEVLAKLLTSTNFECEFQDVKTADLMAWPKHYWHSVIVLFSDTRKPSDASRAAQRVGLARQLHGRQPEGDAKTTGIIGNMALVNSCFHTRKKFSENYLQFGHVSCRILANHVLGRKKFKNMGLKWRQTICLPGASACLAPALGPSQLHGAEGVMSG